MQEKCQSALQSVQFSKYVSTLESSGPNNALNWTPAWTIGVIWEYPPGWPSKDVVLKVAGWDGMDLRVRVGIDLEHLTVRIT